MLQRFDIARNDLTNRLSIKEFAYLKIKSHRRDDLKPIGEDFSLVHEISYDCDKIRTAIQKGHRALISVLRTKDFFPVLPCVEVIAVKVTVLFSNNSEPTSEVFFDDRSILGINDVE
jgi:hypothetical protein